MAQSNDHNEPEARITPRLIDGFYTRRLIIADEARAYLTISAAPTGSSSIRSRASEFACESLKVTTRIMHMSPGC